MCSNKTIDATSYDSFFYFCTVKVQVCGLFAREGLHWPVYVGHFPVDARDSIEQGQN